MAEQKAREGDLPFCHRHANVRTKQNTIELGRCVREVGTKTKGQNKLVTVELVVECELLLFGELE